MNLLSSHEPANHSPWYPALTQSMFPCLDSDQIADVLIIGGGIAGMASAYFIMEQTGRSCVLLEADRIAAGATGHNAGQAVNGIEADLGILKAAVGYEGIARAFEAGEVGRRLLLELLNSIQSPGGYIEVPTIALFRQRRLLSQVVRRAMALQRIRNVPVPLYACAKAFSLLPKNLRALVTKVSRTQLSAITGVSSRGVLGAAFFPASGLLNAADLTRGLAVRLSQKFGTSFKIFEGSPAARISACSVGFEAKCLDFTVRAKSVVLATNGYAICGSGFKTPRMKSIVQGCLGYVSDGPRPLTAIGFSLLEKTKNYYYANTRQFSGTSFLTVTGGPPGVRVGSSNEAAALQADFDELDIHSSHLGLSPNHQPRFRWTGILAYMPDGLRWIGADPENPSVYYNLGCNGIGILLSIFGGYAIACQMRGQPMQTVFLPR